MRATQKQTWNNALTVAAGILYARRAAIIMGRAMPMVFDEAGLCNDGRAGPAPQGWDRRSALPIRAGRFQLPEQSGHPNHPYH